jgi:hypothetical protein
MFGKSLRMSNLGGNRPMGAGWPTIIERDYRNIKIVDPTPMTRQAFFCL